jgi:hypothetical protein
MADGHSPPEPEEPFRLTPAERAGLSPDLDADAVERLLGALSGEARAYVARFCRDWSGAGLEALLAAFPEVEPRGGHGSFGVAVPELDHLGFDDPALQALLDAAVAPKRAREAAGPRPPEA